MVVSQRARSLLSAPLAATLLSVPNPGPHGTGDLDPTFGHNGSVLTGFESASAQDLASYVAVRQTATSWRSAAPSPADLALAGYEADGRLDPESRRSKVLSWLSLAPLEDLSSGSMRDRGVLDDRREIRRHSPQA